MKNIFSIVLLFVLFVNYSFSQCTPNTSFTSPGLYPDTLPEGTVGQAYAETVTFVMPTDTSGFDFTNFEIVPFHLILKCGFLDLTVQVSFSSFKNEKMH